MVQEPVLLWTLAQVSSTETRGLATCCVFEPYSYGLGLLSEALKIWTVVYLQTRPSDKEV